MNGVILSLVLLAFGLANLGLMQVLRSRVAIREIRLEALRSRLTLSSIRLVSRLLARHDFSVMGVRASGLAFLASVRVSGFVPGEVVFHFVEGLDAPLGLHTEVNGSRPEERGSLVVH